MLLWTLSIQQRKLSAILFILTNLIQILSLRNFTISLLKVKRILLSFGSVQVICQAWFTLGMKVHKIDSELCGLVE